MRRIGHFRKLLREQPPPGPVEKVLIQFGEARPPNVAKEGPKKAWPEKGRCPFGTSFLYASTALCRALAERIDAQRHTNPKEAFIDMTHSQDFSDCTRDQIRRVWQYARSIAKRTDTEGPNILDKRAATDMHAVVEAEEIEVSHELSDAMTRILHPDRHSQNIPFVPEPVIPDDQIPHQPAARRRRT